MPLFGEEKNIRGFFFKCGAGVLKINAYKCKTRYLLVKTLYHTNNISYESDLLVLFVKVT